MNISNKFHHLLFVAFCLIIIESLTIFFLVKLGSSHLTVLIITRDSLSEFWTCDFSQYEYFLRAYSSWGYMEEGEAKFTIQSRDFTRPRLTGRFACSRRGENGERAEGNDIVRRETLHWVLAKFFTPKWEWRRGEIASFTSLSFPLMRFHLYFVILWSTT